MDSLRSVLSAGASRGAFAVHRLEPASALATDQQWQLALSRKLELVLAAIAKRIKGLGLLQVWRPVVHQPGFDLRQQLYADPQLLVMGDAGFAQFRLSSCQSLQYGHQGMPGRALRSGCVQVVQNLRIIPAALHPRCRIPEGLADSVGEVVYVPVYDTLRPYAGPVAVLEALLSSRAADAMLVATFISYAGTALATFKLSLSSPLPQPVKRSKLEGRKPRPAHPASAEDLAGAAGAAPAAAAAAIPAPTQSPATHVAVHMPAAAQLHEELQAKMQQAPLQRAGSDECASPLAIAAAIDAAAKRLCQQQSQCQPVQASNACCGPVAATVSASSECCIEEQHPAAAISCSTGSAATAVAGIALAEAVCAGTATGAATDSNLCSTSSSRPTDEALTAAIAAAAAAAMPPPAPCDASNKQLHCRSRLRWEQESCDEAEEEDVDEVAGLLIARPSKMQRTLSMCRTKSVPLGLDQILDAAVAGSC